jgi:hypothetical protein
MCAAHSIRALRPASAYQATLKIAAGVKFTFRQLAYFIAAAETGSITLANVRPRTGVALDGRRVFRVPLSGDPPPVVGRRKRR